MEDLGVDWRIFKNWILRSGRVEDGLHWSG
jgi:hypothetical protein